MIDSRIVITPNFDKIYETYAVKETQGTTVVKNYYDSDIVDCIRRNEPLVIKIHGSIDSPQQLIFSKKDYAMAWNKHRDFYKIIESLMLSHTFLFLGAGLNDPDIKLLLESISFQFSPMRQHYFVISSDQIDPISEEILSDIYNLKFIKYSSDNYHAQFGEEISNLWKYVEVKRNDRRIE